MDTSSRTEVLRQAFGRQLREWRTRAGVSGRRLAELSDVSQAKISRIETGLAIPTGDELKNLLDALKVKGPDRRGLLTLAEEISDNAVFNWRPLLQSGLAGGQTRVAELEAESSLVRELQAALVPGLLQTAEYATAIMTSLPPSEFFDAEQAVGSRLERQKILYTSRRFRFLLWEGCLLTRVVDAPVMHKQLLWLLHVGHLENVEIGIVPFAARLKKAPFHSFTIYDDKLVEAGLYTDVVHVQAPGDVAHYITIFESFSDVAIFGSDAAELIRQRAQTFADEG